MSSKDVGILRDLAGQYLDICAKDVQDERRGLWRKHNSFKGSRIPICVRTFAWGEMPQPEYKCEDPFYRRYERQFHRTIFHDSLGDDFIFEPWVSVGATCVTPEEGIWGLKTGWIKGDDPRGAKRIDPPIKEPEDAKGMLVPSHVIDEKKTAEDVSKLQDAIGDVITVDVNRVTAYGEWAADISTHLGYLRGVEQIMWDMMDRPEWLHELLGFMRDGILKAHKEAEEAGDWALSQHNNQVLCYAEELDDPAPDSGGITRDKLWAFFASQETTLVGPDMFDEFIVKYQLPIMEKFGLVAYGCCEDLTTKIDVLKQIPNLRRISITPVMDAGKCAEQIGRDYIISYRPSPTDMVGYGFDEERIRRILREDLTACRGCCVDICLKDVETVEGDPDRVRRWVEVTREVIEEFQ